MVSHDAPASGVKNAFTCRSCLMLFAVLLWNVMANFPPSLFWKFRRLVRSPSTSLHLRSWDPTCRRTSRSRPHWQSPTYQPWPSLAQAASVREKSLARLRGTAAQAKAPSDSAPAWCRPISRATRSHMVSMSSDQSLGLRSQWR